MTDAAKQRAKRARWLASPRGKAWMAAYLERRKAERAALRRRRLEALRAAGLL